MVDSLKNFYEMSDLYDAENAALVEDIAFWDKLFDDNLFSGHSVAELGCGTGRIGLKIYSRFKMYHGVDFSQPALDKFKQQVKDSDNVVLYNQDVRSFTLDEKVDTIICPFNLLLLFHTLQDFKSIISSIKRNLKDGGIFVIDVFNPQFRFLTRDSNKEYLRSEFEFSGRQCMLYEKNKYCIITQVNNITRRYQIEGRNEDIFAELNMRVLFPQELQNMLNLLDMKIIKMYGNYDFSELSDRSEKQIYICQSVE